VQRDTRAARRLTGDPVWRLAAHVPFAGRSLRATAGLAAAVDDLARTTLPDVQAATTALSLRTLRPSGDRVALDPLAAALPPLRRVRASVAETEARVRALPASFVVAPVRDARRDFLAELASLRTAVTDATTAVGVAPSMLGRDGVRRYFVAFLNNAEMRGSGGLLGAYGILEADRGRLRMRTLGTNADLVNTTTPATTLDADFVARYRRFAADSYWVNANMSPHFPTASAIWTALWARTHRGERLDGTIAVDPVALSAILGATGPATLPGGERVDARNVVPLTEQDAYQRFATDNDARDRYLQTVARAAYLEVVGARDTVALLRALATAAGSRHLQVASEHPDEQAMLAPTPIAGVLPETAAPFLEVTTQNAGGNKLDYYLRRAVTYQRVDAEHVRVEVRLTNVAPPGLPHYVTDRLDLPGLTAPVPGQQHVYLSVFTTAGSGLAGATLDGRAVTMESEVERGHPVLSTFLDVDPGRERLLVLDLTDRTSGPPAVRRSPVVFPDVVHIG
jgi:hypothetical protein